MKQTVAPVTLARFGAAHLADAVALSAAESWPHRAEDWQLIMDLSEGRAADCEGRLVGTAFCTAYGDAVACLNMIIVAQAMRGRGLGRRLMAEIMALAGDRQMRLVATQSGLPLYRKMGFREVGRILQQQGVAAEVAAPEGVEPARPADAAALAALDRAAFGADRIALIDRLTKVADVVVLRGTAGITGAAWCRGFGRGRVIGPVIAPSAEAARRLIAAHVARHPGAFLRIDTPEEAGLQGFLEDCGLAPAGGGVVMHHGDAPARAGTAPTSFALASQALG
ncbi:GNAT family N-acetyltransferase [Roseivivax sp. CAU 1761]